MRHPTRWPTTRWPMETLIMIALGFTVIATLFAMHNPPGDRTRFTLERSDAPRIMSQRALLPVSEETALGR